MEPAFKCRQDSDGTFSVRHLDNLSIAMLNNVEMKGLDVTTANAVRDRLEIFTHKIFGIFNLSTGMMSFFR